MNIPKYLGALIVGLAFLVSVSGVASALDGKAIVADRCGSCHDLRGPAPATFGELRKRKAPDLFYAGSKFKRSWLVGWLRNPTPIRPSGVMFLDHIVVEEGKDKIAADTLKTCQANLGREEAEAAADHLMTLVDGSMKTGVIDPVKKFSKSKGRRLFTKQLPCIACHIAKFGKRTMGGISGPDLTEAGKRLNPDWVYARIADPLYWDPMTWMPKIEMSHKKRELLTLLIGSME